jgi:4-amino-4-deoxy-L-arabinose transferase-like glycosyltransferase
LIWLCFVVRGLFYCSVLPLWDGFDEWAHFAVIERMRSAGTLLIDRSSPVSREIDASLSLAPLPRGMTFHPAQGVVRESYWQLPAEERRRRETELAALPPEWSSQHPPGGTTAYEASQAPLYYWLMTIPASLLRQFPLVDRVWGIRILSFLLGSLSIPLGYATARRFFESERVAVGLTLAVAMLPELALTLSRVSNEGLAVVAYTTLLLTGIRWVEGPELTEAIPVGLALSFSLLTKAYALSAVPALLIVGVAIAATDRQRRRSILASSVAIVAIVMLLSSWWYARTYIQTGTISGLDEAITLRETGALDKLYGVSRVDWWPALKTITASHIWYGGWNLVGARLWIYRFWWSVMAVVGVGFFKALFSRQNRRFYFFLSVYGLFWLGQAYQVTALQLSKGVSTSMGGWYLYSVIWAEIILGVVALRSLFAEKYHSHVFAVLLAAIAVTDFYGMHSALIPYYVKIGKGSWDLSRLLINQPSLLGRYGSFVLWGGYVVSTVVLLVMGVVLAFKSNSRARYC